MPCKVVAYFPHISRWCTLAFCFLFSLDWSLQLGLKRRERNVVKSVVICKSEEQRNVCTGADSCISTDVLARKETQVAV